jgi:hypothetical protein
MRFHFPGVLSAFVFAAFLAAPQIQAQPAPEGFHWVDFHSQSDENVVVWVTRALAVENWTAIREIGVEYDAALVVTTLRSSPESAPRNDSFAVWSVSLTNHQLTPLLKGVNLRLLDWMLFAQGRPRELAAMYDNCTGCQASTFFTAFHYDMVQHAWAARWLESGQGAPVWTANTPAQIDLTQAYAVMAEDNGHEYLATLRHFDYGKRKPADDFVYVYDVNPFTGLDRIQVKSGRQADDMELEICRAQDVVSSLARGQDSPFCLSLVGSRPARKPVTAPPDNGRGQSMPPGAKREKTSN